jgi:hypothetical protein
MAVDPVPIETAHEDMIVRLYQKAEEQLNHDHSNSPARCAARLLWQTSGNVLFGPHSTSI